MSATARKCASTADGGARALAVYGIDERTGHGAIQGVGFDPARQQGAETQRSLEHRSCRPPRSVLGVDQTEMNLAFVPVARAADELRALLIEIDGVAASGKL